MTNKIPLYKVRNFSEKFNATFEFVRQNWRLILRLSVYLLLPFSIIQGIFAESYYSDILKDVFVGSTSDYDDMPMGSLSVLCIAAFFSAIMLISLIYTVMKRYEQSDDDISMLTLKDLWPLIKHNIGKSVIAMITYILVYVVITVILSIFIGIGAAFSFGSAMLASFLTFALIAASIPPMSLLMPIYLLEDDAKLWSSLKKAIVYGFKTWGGLVALMFVIGIITTTLSYLIMIPGLVLAAFKSALFPATFIGNGFLPLIYTIIQDIFIIAGQYASYLLGSLMLIALGFHYGHTAEAIDGVTVDEEIDHFNELADSGEDYEEDVDAPQIPDLEEPKADKKDDIDNFNNL